MAEALVALGGNIGDVRDTLDRAIAAFCEDEKVRLLARSSDYRTAPWGVEDQPPFVNLCIAVETTLAPRALLARAQAVERALGRERSKERRWGPRPVDIDLVAYDDLVLQEADLTRSCSPAPLCWRRSRRSRRSASSPAGVCAMRWRSSTQAGSRSCPLAHDRRPRSAVLTLKPHLRGDKA
jgi:2-amino-4-hydroxy-6-hydroxymethyldihydropteridine diphosphokinase